tara:strand:+ start:1316 stop:2095 length:780 start_codon:yes stop_codon:yes gene_type:complete
MSSFKHLPISLQKSLDERRLLKVIAGLKNFDKGSVSLIAKAARRGHADLLDLACDPELVRLAITNSGLPICVSAVDPKLFPSAVEAGASMIEIGNYDSFYPEGRFFYADEILALTDETKKLLPNVFLSVTVPHTLPLDKQSELALDLIKLGVDLIQTEGGTSSQPLSAGCLGLIEKAAPTLAAAHSISEDLKSSGYSVPLICASGLSAVTCPMAFAAGASGVGVGSVVNRLTNEIEMIAVIRSIREAIDSSRCLTEKLL